MILHVAPGLPLLREHGLQYFPTLRHCALARARMSEWAEGAVAVQPG